MSNISETAKSLSTISVNKNKTEELINKLKLDGMKVEVEDLGEYLRKQGVIVKVHIKRKSCELLVDPKMLGIDLKKGIDDKLNNFWEAHMESSKMTFIGKIEASKFKSIDGAVRSALKSKAVGYEYSFLLMDDYYEFLEYFGNKKKEYMETADGVYNQWDFLLDEFKKNLMVSLKMMNAIDIEKVYAEVIEKIPSKEDFRKSFDMQWTAKAFPVVENLDMFEDKLRNEIKNGISEDTMRLLFEVMGSTLNDAFQALNNIVNGYSTNKKIVSKTISSVKKSISRLRRKNIFQNVKIEDIRADMQGVLMLDAEEMNEKAQIIMANIFVYAKELELESKIDLEKCNFNENQLIEIYKVMSNNPTLYDMVESEKAESKLA